MPSPVQQLLDAGDGRAVLGSEAARLGHGGEQPPARESQVAEREPQGIDLRSVLDGDTAALYQRQFNDCLRRVFGI